MASIARRADLRGTVSAPRTSPSLWRLWCSVILLLLACALPVRAVASPETVVHLLDYISVDYPEFVQKGKVLDEAEYKEQQEFSRQVMDLLRASSENPRRGELLDAAARLARRIDAKAPAEEIAGLASALRWEVIEAYGLAVAPRQIPQLEVGAQLYAGPMRLLSRRPGARRRTCRKGAGPASVELPQP